MDDLENLITDFEVLDDWEDRYRHVIDIGRALPEFPEQLRTAANKVQGCASQVWIASRVGGDPSQPVLHLQGDSDALIVKGLIAIAFMIYSGKPAGEISDIDAGAILQRLGLDQHLTPQRSNGFASMITRIKRDARSAVQASSAG